MPPIDSKFTHKIGIMADSHGQAESIANALTLFEEYNCEAIYHLGDICDSAHPETADHCVSLLHQNNIFGIKGNNDHQVVVNHEDRQNTPLASTTIEYLKQLPLTRELGYSIMAHSLPFVKERGLSSMIGVLGQSEVALFFQTYPHKILFRGHSHCPEILRQHKQSVKIGKILAGETIQLADIQPCIITCGALDQGFMMIWEPGKQALTCHTLT